MMLLSLAEGSLSLADKIDSSDHLK